MRARRRTSPTCASAPWPHSVRRRPRLHQHFTRRCGEKCVLSAQPHPPPTPNLRFVVKVSRGGCAATDERAEGRNPAKMERPAVPADAPPRVLRSIPSWGRLSACGLRLLGHPALLSIAEAIHGEDFTPFSGANEEMIVKVAGYAPSVAWVRHSLTPTTTTTTHTHHPPSRFAPTRRTMQDSALTRVPLRSTRMARRT